MKKFKVRALLATSIVGLLALLAYGIYYLSSPSDLEIVSSVWGVTFSETTQTNLYREQPGPHGDGYRFLSVSIPEGTETTGTILDEKDFSAKAPSPDTLDMMRADLKALSITAAGPEHAIQDNKSFTYQLIHKDANLMVIAHDTSTKNFYFFQELL